MTNTFHYWYKDRNYLRLNAAPSVYVSLPEEVASQIYQAEMNYIKKKKSEAHRFLLDWEWDHIQQALIGGRMKQGGVVLNPPYLVKSRYDGISGFVVIVWYRQASRTSGESGGFCDTLQQAIEEAERHFTKVGD